MPPLYLDYNATTPLDPRVFEAMKPWFLDEPGNAGSRTHIFGQRARDAVEKARAQVAELIAAKPEEIVFTSGATESNNIAILGLAQHGEATGRRHVICTAIEHKAVLEPLARLAEIGFEVEHAPVTSGGYVEPDEIRKRLRPDTLLVSVMHANNETGVLQPVEEIAEILGGTQTFFHVDAAQTFGKEVAAMRSLRCDFISVSGHKIYGPKGIGALVVHRRGGQRSPLAPITRGGGQERGLRPGTLPIPLAVGLGEAARLAGIEHEARRAGARRIKAEFVAALFPLEHEINGDQALCQPHVINVSFRGVDSEALMMAAQNEFAFSNGSACTSAAYSPSHVLRAMGLDDDRVSSAVRISWGPWISEIPVGSLAAALGRLR